jgi:DNA-binding NarL/FixJ family response regulator
MTIRMLLVDDHPVVREGLRSMLTDGAIDIVGEAGTAAEAMRLCVEVEPDVVLLDMALPDLDGVSTLRRIKHARPGATVLVLSMHDDPALVRSAVQAGAAGYLLKGVARQELLAAVRAVRHGEAVIDPALLRSLSADPGAAEPLTAIERGVLQLIASGRTNREIAGQLRWSVATVKKYVQRVLAKLEVSDRTQAAVVALRLGLLDQGRSVPPGPRR